MNDPVLRVLAVRQALADQGYSKSLLLSGAAHASTFFALVILALLTPRPKVINVIDGFAVPLPRGGGAPQAVEPVVAPPAETAAPPPVEAPKEAPAAPAPVLIKPEPVAIKKGLAPVELKRSLKDPKKLESRAVAKEKVTSAVPPKSAAPVPTPGAATAATGLDFTATTPGVSNGTEGAAGPIAFYLAAAQNKIWTTWLRQLRPDFSGSVTVGFTIHRDGSIDQIEVIESSGSSALDRLAERAILSTQLGPVPNAYEKETIAIHATFKPLN